MHTDDCTHPHIERTGTTLLTTGARCVECGLLFVVGRLYHDVRDEALDYRRTLLQIAAHPTRLNGDGTFAAHSMRAIAQEAVADSPDGLPRSL